MVPFLSAIFRRRVTARPAGAHAGGFRPRLDLGDSFCRFLHWNEGNHRLKLHSLESVVFDIPHTTAKNLIGTDECVCPGASTGNKVFVAVPKCLQKRCADSTQIVASGCGLSRLAWHFWSGWVFRSASVRQLQYRCIIFLSHSSLLLDWIWLALGRC